ncbi:hypothetical protein L873DRAFT_1690702 [Choiromyces venosus 120613-1]|uniref:PIN domain-containing protein n=1 Tax=Choiromyces venosus 120613-1 TaxID=1336337 RepID=A0A3N4JGT9_9PEZI|nr:hypothetical protein L873DRAFT_1690702 [Choiromyces venosus 120613-1]
MVDLEKWEDINEVAHVVAEDRVSERAVRRRPEGLAPGHRVSDATHVLVVDTSFLLAHVGLVNDLVLSYRDWGCVVVIPWATIEELDGLKKSPRFVNPGNTHGYPGSMRDYHGRIDISVLARGANRWAFEVLSKPEPGVWGQTKEEVFEGTFNQGDMAILDCARYFYDQGYSTCLLTNDFNLSVKALVYKIKAFMYERGQTWKTLLTKIYGASERLRHLPQSKELSTQPTGSKVEQRQRLVNRVESRTERKAEQIADSEIVRDAERNAVAGVLPHNPMRGSYIAPMVTRPYRESRNNVSSNRHRSSSPLNDQVQQRPVEGMEKSMYVPRNRIRETSETNSAVGHVQPIGKVRAGTDLIMSAASSPRLWNLLREIQEKALTWFNVAMNYHIRLTEPEYVKLDPEEIIHNLLQLENFMLKYHSVVFGAFLPEETHCQLVSRYFSGTLSDLQKRTGADSPSSLRGNASRRPLSCSEVWDFIDSLFDLRKVLTRNGRDLQLMRDIWPVQRWKMRAEQCFIKSLIE